MNILYFLRERTGFIRNHYESVHANFQETKRKINDEEPPYDEYPPGFNPEDGEPAYLEEWLAADTSQEFVGQSCVSFLAASLKLFLDEARAIFRGFSPLPEFDTKHAREHGFVAANQKWFGSIGIDFADAGVDLPVVEEIVTTRNSAQHPDSLLSMNVTLKGKQVRRRPGPLFAHDYEIRSIDPEDPEALERFSWTISITRDKFLQCVDEVERLCAFVDDSSQSLKHRVTVAGAKRRRAARS